MPSSDTAEPTVSAKAVKVPTDRKVKRATLESLRDKKSSKKEVYLVLNGEEASFLFKAISAKEYDKLLNVCPPTVDQRANGAIYNINVFAPALLAKVVVEPELSEDEWAEFWVSPEWNRGELMSFFGEAVDLCNTGLSLGPTATV